MLMSHIAKVAEKNMYTSMLPKVKEVTEKFNSLFSLFGNCHRGYNCEDIDDPRINQLGEFASLLPDNKIFNTFSHNYRRRHWIIHDLLQAKLHLYCAT